MISYYELLGMIKEKKAPNRIKVHLTSKPKIYKARYDDEDFNYYELDDEDDDENYSCYLSDSYLESMMFDETIEILEEDKKIDKIKTLNNVGNSRNLVEFQDKQQLNNHILKDKINEIIDVINKGE